MRIFPKRINTWEELLGLKYNSALVEKGEEKHKEFYRPTKELATISLKTVQKLLKKGQDPNWKDKCGKPLLAHLMMAQSSWNRTQSWNGARPEVIKYLLQNGANPNVSYIDAFKGEETLLEAVSYGNINSHKEPNTFVQLLLENGANPEYQDSGIKSLGHLLTSAIPQDMWRVRAKLLLETGKIDFEKPIFYDKKDSLADRIKNSCFTDDEAQDFIYPYYKKQSPEKADLWYGEILLNRQKKEELKRHEEAKRRELALYQQKQRSQVDPTQALRVTAAALGVIAASYGLASAAQKYHERVAIANSPIGRIKRFFGIRSL